MCKDAPAGTEAGAAAACVVCWAGWVGPRAVGARAEPASLSWGTRAVGPSGRPWGGNLALA